MKKIAAILLAVLSLSLILTACAKEPADVSDPHATKPPLPEGFHFDPMTFSPDFFSTPAPVPEQTDPAVKAEVLFAESFIGGGGEAVEKTEWKLYEDLDALQADYRNLPESLSGLKNDDFASMVVVAVTDVVRTGGFTFNFNSLEVSDGEIHIDCKKTAPSKGSMVTMAFQTNVVLIGISREVYTPGMNCVITVNGMPAYGAVTK